jgi:hypothetical protein
MPHPLHKEWTDFKTGIGAEMIKTLKLNFNQGLGPALENLEKNNGTAKGQKNADDLKVIVGKYRALLEKTKTMKVKLNNTEVTGAYGDQRDKAGKILTKIITLANAHKVTKK